MPTPSRTTAVVLLALALAPSPGVIGLGGLANPTPPQDRAPAPTDQEKKALAILAEDVGTWECKWEWLDPNGKVVEIMEGTETWEYLYEPRVLRLTTHVPAKKTRSAGMKFFDPNEKRIRFLNVSDRGDFWDMEESIDTLRVTSLPHRNPDGSTMAIRFSVLKKTKDMRRLLMEYTRDGGKTWVKGNYQTITRTTGKVGR